MSEIIIFLLLFFIFNAILGNYNVQKDAELSYLYRKYDKVNEDIFPRDLSVSVYLTRILGILIYSIDKHGNQLIVSLNGADVHTIRLEFNKQKYSYSLSTLCGCESCKYEILSLRIQIKESIYLQCNNGAIETIKYTSNKQINKAYPIPYNYSEQTNNKSPNEAHLWMVNHKQYGNVYPSYDQLSGCIKDVRYINEPIIFTEISDNIARRCAVVCTENICNGGECIETYDAVPICNCTTTFLNGDYCNDTVRSMNIRSDNQVFSFALLKLSWQSTATELVKLKSRDVIVGVYAREKNLKVKFQYLRNGVILSTQSILFDNYKINTKYILIINIQKMNIMTQLFNKESSRSINITAMEDLIQVKFDIIELRSGEGIIDLSYKRDSKDLKWKKIKYDKEEQLTPDLTVAQICNSDPSTNTPKISLNINHNSSLLTRISITLALVVVLCLLMLGNIAISIVRPGKFKQMYANLNGTSRLLISDKLNNEIG